jgi:hypothetical protein
MAAPGNAIAEDKEDNNRHKWDITYLKGISSLAFRLKGSFVLPVPDRAISI